MVVVEAGVLVKAIERWIGTLTGGFIEFKDKQAGSAEISTLGDLDRIKMDVAERWEHRRRET